jgi:hypothetical protein
MRPVALAGILASTTMLGGCAGTIAGVSFSSISSFAGFASTIFTGADLGEHAASIVTGKDCRFSEGLVREDRDICEEPGSLATRADFHGIFVERIDEDGTVIYAAPKYMSASVGAGENENNPDQIWAEIKEQKAKEEGERQLARAEAAQTIDVAALAASSLSPKSLTLLPGGVKVTAEFTEGETASQTASHPRAVVNAAAKKEIKQKGPVIQTALDIDQPAIEETALTATLEAAKSNGQGGPLITTTATSAPVASKLVNGEPVVILQLGPIFGAAQAAQETASASPMDLADPVEEDEADTPTLVALPMSTKAVTAKESAPSPQAFLKAAPRVPTFPTEVASIEPQMIEARPQPKPSAAELVAAAEVAKPKPARTRAPLEELADQPDVYRPPSRETPTPVSTASVSYVNSPAPELTAPVQVPGDVPAQHSALPAATTPSPAMSFGESAVSSSPLPAATSGPAPLYPVAQP